MWIEVSAPCFLPLGLVPANDQPGAPIGLLGITLQYPPVSLFATARPDALSVTGARANWAYQVAERFCRSHNLPPSGEIEIELSTPNAMGLSSDAGLALAVSRALAHLNDLPTEDTAALAQAAGLGPEQAPPMWGFDRGGLLLVEANTASGATPQILRRHELAHKDTEAWAFVLHLPRTPEDLSPTLERDRLTALNAAAPHLPVAPAREAAAHLWPAVENGDLPAFAQALTHLQDLTHQALAAVGTPHELDASEHATLDLMRQTGTLAAGRSLTGLALFGLVKGSWQTIELKKKLNAHIGHYGGITMASVCDNQGARLQQHKTKPPLGAA